MSIIWYARVSVTRKTRGTGVLVTCKEVNVARKSYAELSKAIEFIMNTYERDIWCCTCVISPLKENR